MELHKPWDSRHGPSEHNCLAPTESILEQGDRIGETLGWAITNRQILRIRVGAQLDREDQESLGFAERSFQVVFEGIWAVRVYS